MNRDETNQRAVTAGGAETAGAEDRVTISPVAYIRTGLREKYGIPRQAGVVPELRGEVVFTPDFRDENCLRDIEGFEYLWLIWGFSGNRKREWSPTVRPPRLGGNRRVGVFASRSPVRPNYLGLSCVRLLEVKKDPEKGMVLVVGGADLMDGTPIYDVKPYVPYSDSKPGARGGFTDSAWPVLQVVIPEELERRIPERLREALRGVLSQDPRSGYQRDDTREHGMRFGEQNIKFKADEGILTVTSVEDVTGEDR